MGKYLKRLVFLLVALAAADVLAAPVVAFKPLKLPRTPTTSTLSSDGRTLIVAAEEDNELLLVDVVTGRTTRRVPCPSPRHILTRGDKVFVANFGHGTISVFEPGADWRQVGQLGTGRPDVYCLSAAQGKYFDGRLFASCGPSDAAWVAEIDTVAGKLIRAHEPKAMSLARVSYDGRYVLNLRGGRTETWTYASYGQGQRPDHSTQDATVGLIEQFHSGGFLFSPRTAYLGVRPQQVAGLRGGLIIPDVSRRMFYALRPDRLEARRLDGAVTLIAERPITAPDWVTNYKPRDEAQPWLTPHAFRHPGDRSTSRQADWLYFTKWRKNLTLHPAEAVTLDDRLYLFLPGPDGFEIFYAATEAFDPALPQVEQPVEPPLHVKFEPVPTPDATTSMAMTEGGKYLVVAHELSDQLSVWDVLTGRMVKLLSCPAPRFVLCRGEQIFVASFGHGRIRVFSSRDWSVQDELGAGGKNVYYLSAPGGQYFRGELVVSCGGAKAHDIYVVDTREDRARHVQWHAPERTWYETSGTATVSFDGQYVIEQQLARKEFRQKILGVFRYRDYMKKDKESLGGWQTRWSTLLYQARASELWLAGKHLLTGIPPKRGRGPLSGLQHDRETRLLIPDLLRDVFYVYREGEMRCLTLDSARRELDLRTAAPLFDATFRRPGYRLDNVWRVAADHDSLIMAPPIAATHGGQTFIYLLCHDSLRLMRCRTRALGQQEDGRP